MACNVFTRSHSTSRKSVSRDSKEIAKASVFAEPFTLSALSVNEARRRICREVRKLTTDETLGLIYKRRDVMVAEINRQQVANNSFFLDPKVKCAQAQEFDERLSTLIIGQENAVHSMGNLYQLFLAGMNESNRSLGALLFLGPTGSGKTRVVEAAAEILFGDRNAVIKIDCAEFQHSHEIAKLVGSPPGYLGHRETSPLLTQENLDRFQTEDTPLSLVLFDEIEKASDSLWKLLLGILDKATLTLGDNRRVDFSRSLIIMTSNLGAREISELIEGRIGFTAPQQLNDLIKSQIAIDEKIQRTAVQAASRNFSPEFMNRIDKTVVFHSLNQKHLQQILDLELCALKQRIMRSARTQFFFSCSDSVKELLLREGTDSRYGARHLKRSIERLLVLPLANLVASGQVCWGDSIYVDLDHNGSDISFARRSLGMTIDNSFLTEPSVEEFGAPLHAAQLSQLAAA
jgi:ATP-dependent Clp protease ATP-binding subunit ClpB